MPDVILAQFFDLFGVEFNFLIAKHRMRSRLKQLRIKRLRAGTTTVYSFGDDASKLGQYAWYSKNAWNIGEKYAHRVGRKLPNPWGLYDMHGNVWECCQDWYAPYGTEKTVSDPMGPALGTYRLLRGGSFANPASSVRSAFRNYLLPTTRYGGFGFRPSRTYNLSP